MNRDRLSRALRALLPAAAAGALWLAVAVSLASAAEADASHVVKDGETLASIAADHGLTVTGLLALNPGLAGVVYVGQTLQVPGDIDPGQAPPVVCPLEIEVRAGDTLAALAAAHGVPAGTLALVNRLDPETVPAAGTRLCVPTLPEPASRIACEDAPQYVLQRTPPVTLMNASRTFPGGHQVCVETTWSVGGTERHWVRTEDGLSGWMRGDAVGTWQAYLASRNAPQPPPTPTATRRPTRTPTPVPTATPAAAVCRDAWGASAVAYRVRTGPGTHHAHTGKYVAAGQAVCELRRDQGWVQVRLADGTAGWVHGDGITNNQPTPTPIPTATPAVPPAAISQTAAAPIPATTASGIVIRSHEYDFAIDMPEGAVWEQRRWFERWAGHWGPNPRRYHQLHVWSYLLPSETTLEQYVQSIRNDPYRPWEWWYGPGSMSDFRLQSMEKHRTGGQESYRLVYRVRGPWCILEVEEAIAVGYSPVGPVQGFRAQYFDCADNGDAQYRRFRRGMLDSFRVVSQPIDYYSQYLERDGLWIKTASHVDPRALHAASATLDLMMGNIRSDIPACMLRDGAAVAIIPKDAWLIHLPEWASFRGQTDHVGRSYDGPTHRGQGTSPVAPVTSTSEEDLLRLPGNTSPDIDVLIHEFAHAIHSGCFTPADHAQLDAFYDEAIQTGLWAGDYAVSNKWEFFAVVTTLYFNEDDTLRRFGITRSRGHDELKKRLPELYAFIDGIFNAG